MSKTSDSHAFDHPVSSKITRRHLLGVSAAAAVAGVVTPAWARIPTDRERSVAFIVPRTQERIETAYWRDGNYLPDALQAINYAMRDGRDNTMTRIDLGLLDQLFTLRRHLGTDRPFTLVCGYRSPTTNALLRSRRRGVARNSYHMYGEASDIRMEGVPLRTLRNAAVALAWGGVGYYGRSNFVHVDVGPQRTW